MHPGEYKFMRPIEGITIAWSLECSVSQEEIPFYMGYIFSLIKSGTCTTNQLILTNNIKFETLRYQTVIGLIKMDAAQNISMLCPSLTLWGCHKKGHSVLW